MNRRDLLKALGMTSVIALLPVTLPAVTPVPKLHTYLRINHLYIRGTGHENRVGYGALYREQNSHAILHWHINVMQGGVDWQPMYGDELYFTDGLMPRLDISPDVVMGISGRWDTGEPYWMTAGCDENH
jgi:hypothetical protein